MSYSSPGKGNRLLRFFVCIILLLISFPASAAFSPQREALSYDVSLFHFWKAIEVEIRLDPTVEKGLYVAHLRLQPNRFLKRFTSYERYEFTSKLRVVPSSLGGERLRLEYFEKESSGKRLYRGVYQFDYDKGVMTGQGFFDGKPLPPETFSLPTGQTPYYDDFLCFFYNLRSGKYDQLKPGERVEIHSIPSKGKSIFTLARTDKMTDEEGNLFRLDINRDFMGIHINQFLIWLSKDGLPTRGLAQNVIGWGDVVSVLRKS